MGDRPAGTDGSDFMFRQRVAKEYGQSASLKRTIKKVFLAQVVCSLVVTGLTAVESMDDMQTVAVLAGASLAFVFLGNKSLTRNNSTMLWAFIFGNTLIAVASGFTWVVQPLMARTLPKGDGEMPVTSDISLGLHTLNLLVSVASSYVAHSLVGTWNISKKKK